MITPSLEEMAYVAHEMKREKFTLPLLIGGATTSRAHTAIKIEPNYSGPTVHVVDASRAVGVVNQLLSDTFKSSFIHETREEYEKLRQRHLSKKTENEFVSLAEARKNKFAIDWKHFTPVKPSFLGVKPILDFPLRELVDFIDWSPFFQTWELSGSYPKILEDKVVGPAAKNLFADAQVMLNKIISEKILHANAVIGFFPANSVEDDIAIYEDETRSQ